MEYLRRFTKKDYYIGKEEYLRRLQILEIVSLKALKDRDQLFDGDDGVEGFIIYGSYAKSHPVFSRRVFVHNATAREYPSDIDMILLTTDREEEITAQLNKQFDPNESVKAGLLYPDGITIAITDAMFDYGIESSAEALGGINLQHDFEERFEDEYTSVDNFFSGGMLLIMPDGEYKEKIRKMVEQENYPILLSPTLL